MILSEQNVAIPVKQFDSTYSSEVQKRLKWAKDPIQRFTMSAPFANLRQIFLGKKFI